MIASFFQKLLVKEGSDLQVGHRRLISNTPFTVSVVDGKEGSMGIITEPGNVVPESSTK